MKDAIMAKVEQWCRQNPVRLCVLFGSQATGLAEVRSDVDLALWSTQSVTFDMRLRWLAELELMLKKEVSLVIVTLDLNPVLGFEIVRDGLLIFESQPDEWHKRQSQLWHAYNDSLPFRRALRQQLHEYAEEIRRAS